MSSPRTPFRVAAVQASPVFLDRAATTAKACALIQEAAAHGAKLVVFPEAFIPSYPFWVWHVPAGNSAVLRGLYDALLENSVDVPGETTETLGAAARHAAVHVAIGINERNVGQSGTSLFNSILYLDSGGRILGCHRKLVPTSGERLIHAQGDGSTLEVHDTELGKLGGLICWENYMPLARYSLYAAGIELYLAPTWDRGEPWISTLRHIAKEGRVYVLGSCSVVRRSDIPDDVAFKTYLPSSDWINPGDSAIVDPDGKILAGPAREEEVILYAEVDPRLIRGPRFQLDVAGHYARPDVFQLLVDRRRREMVREMKPDRDPAAAPRAPEGAPPQAGDPPSGFTNTPRA